jgi:hypothetical protein
VDLKNAAHSYRYFSSVIYGHHPLHSHTCNHCTAFDDRVQLVCLAEI